MNIYSTGNNLVDQVGQISFTGNIIPQTWYKTIVRANGKPNLRAIIFLSDIVYWYRPTEVRDECTGQIVATKKKFKSDLLQRSYQQLADLFGCSKGEAQSAIADLVQLGVVRCDFRTEVRNGVRSNNIMYLELDVEALHDLTYPQDTENKGIAIPKFRDRVSGEKPIAIPAKADTNTENTQEIIYTEITQSIHPAAEPPFPTSDGMSDEELEELVSDEIWDAMEIPYHYVTDERKMTAAVHLLTEYSIRTTGNHDTLEHEAFLLFNEALIIMLTNPKPMKLKGAHITYAKVLEKLKRYIKRSDSECFISDLVDTATGDFTAACKDTTIRNHLHYMQSCIWNAMQVGNIGVHAMIKRDFG